MTLTLPERRHAFNPNCSSVQNELDCAHPTLDSAPSSWVAARETPVRLSLDNLYRLWLTDRHVPKSGVCEDTLDSQASAERLHSPGSPAIQHRGWLFKELLFIPYKPPGGCIFPISVHFSHPSGQRRDGKSSRQQPRTSQKIGGPIDINIALSRQGFEHATLPTNYSSCVLKLADASAPLHQWSAVNTKHKDNTVRGSRRLVKDSPTVQYKRAGSTNTFIFGEDLAHIFPFDSLALLEQDSRGCIAAKTMKSLGRCSNAMPDKFSMSAAEFAGTVRDISKESCMMSQLDMLESLSNKILCRKGQHSPRAGRKLQGLRAQASARDNANGPRKAVSGLCIVSMKAFPFWLKALSSYTTTCEQQCVTLVDGHVLTSADRLANKNSREGSTSLAITRSSETSTVSSQRSSSAVVRASATSSIHAHRVSLPASLHCGPQKFQQWRPNSRLTVPQLIRQTLEKQIGERSQDSGYVYIYWNPGNFGYVKIGFTAATTVEERLSQWRNTCNHGVEEYTGSIGRQHVPHVYRIECLVLAELRDFRLKELNCPCGRKEHQEWCNTGPQHVAKVRQKWENFMLEQERYESRVGGQFLRHTVSDEEFDRLCRPLPIEKPVSPNTKKASSELRRSPRLREKGRASA